MIIDKLLNGSKTTEKALNAAWLRNEVIAQNIANIDTPGYKRKDVEFEEQLSRAMDSSKLKGFRTDPRHLPVGSEKVEDVSIRVKTDNRNLSMRLDGNNVDIDNEMALMAKNTIKYNALIQRLNGSFNRIKSVINEGR